MAKIIDKQQKPRNEMRNESKKNSDLLNNENLLIYYSVKKQLKQLDLRTNFYLQMHNECLHFWLIVWNYVHGEGQQFIELPPQPDSGHVQLLGVVTVAFDWLACPVVVAEFGHAGHGIGRHFVLDSAQTATGQRSWAHAGSGCVLFTWPSAKM